MKTLLIAVGILLAVNGYSQNYNVGLIKTGSVVRNVEGQIIMSDSIVTSTIEGRSLKQKIQSRNGFTIYVTDGTTAGKYIISHAVGRLHGFTYDCNITYHPEKRHPGTATPVFFCAVKRDSIR